MEQAQRRLTIVASHLSVDDQNLSSLTSQNCHGGDNIPDKDTQPFANKLSGRPYIHREFVRFGWRTIEEGEIAEIWNNYGEVNQVAGPTSCFLWNEYFSKVPYYLAGPNDYLVIEYRDGRKEHIPGPKRIHYSSKEHNSIEVQPAIQIASGYAIVVFASEDGKVTRHVVKGPAKYVPKSNEWLHTFFWWVPNQTGLASAKNRKLIRFKMLRIIPDQLYFDVTDVRTRDDALLTISLMIFYHLQDIEKMLAHTHDPVLELVNSITADVINFASQRTFDQFKVESEKLNLLESYPLTAQKFPRLGYELSKIVYRGYLAGEKLQHMHNSAIEVRTALQLQHEKENQEQDIEDMKLQRKMDRATKERQMSQEQIEHQTQMKALQEEQTLRSLRAQHDETLRQQQAEKESLLQYNMKDAELQSKRQQQTMNNQLDFYKKLHQEVGVNVTQYLVSQNSHPDKLIQVVTAQQNAESTPIHVHSS